MILPGVIVSVVMLILTGILGRFFCGWVCPLGRLIDLVGAFKTKKRILNDAQNKRIRRFKYFILGSVVIAAIFGVQVAWLYDPLVITARFISLNCIPGVTFLIDKCFVWVIQNFNLYGSVYDFYRTLKASFLGINIYYFANSTAIFTFFFVVVIFALSMTRIWCRMLCPLGAIYGLTSKPAFMERVVDGCIQCGKCHQHCRMGAIKEGAGYVKGECILCMDCVYDCPVGAEKFVWLPKRTSSSISPRPVGKETTGSGGNISRRNFLIFFVISICSASFWKSLVWGEVRAVTGDSSGSVIRPPGALKEREFVDRCIRCGNCMKVCITNGLQPVMMQAGIEGVWTPALMPEIGACEYNCNLCGNVCPTGAIPKLPLEIKKKAKLGMAYVDKSICIPWKHQDECIVCEEQCPIPDKAIKLEETVVGGRRFLQPVVDKDLCTGCGKCQYACPVRPVRAIVIKV